MNELVITEHGLKVSKKERRLQISGEDTYEEASIDDLDLVIITGNVMITSSAFRLAADYNVPIHIANHYGEPQSTIYPVDITGNPKLKIRQLEIRRESKGLEIAKKFAEAGITNRANMLRSLGQTRDDEDLKRRGEEILDLKQELKEIEGPLRFKRDEMMNVEGRAAQQYFEALAKVLPRELYEGKRGKRPPTDTFNAALSYGYGMLYPRAHKSAIYAGLDPYLGFLHAEYRRRPGLVMDLVEEFRQPVVDRAIVNIAVRGQLKEEHSEKKNRGTLLNKKGRKLVAHAVMEKLSEEKQHLGKNSKIKRHIRNQGILLANKILGEKAYEAYSPRRP